MGSDSQANTASMPLTMRVPTPGVWIGAGEAHHPVEP
jgi:hypothetical protein